VKNTGKTAPEGLLVMASNHIGCVDDIPSRALEYLRTADLVVFEEDKPARSTLKAAGIHKEYLKFNEHHQEFTLDEVKNGLKAGQTVIYMSDQGSPALADPGRHLNKLAFELGAKVKVIPGPSSVTAALSAAPFECNRFRYVGFPPREPEKRNKFFSNEISTGDTIVLMDTPYRLNALIDELSSTHPQHKSLLAIDVSGENESFLYGSFKFLKTKITKEKLNFVMVIEGSSKTAPKTNKDGNKKRHQKNRRQF
jgi:16S rRNA (cytidine1402-2'-O)-methyltransferase